jgi:C4-dicarboxylate-specific signal transduction histidine kinase
MILELVNNNITNREQEIKKKNDELKESVHSDITSMRNTQASFNKKDTDRVKKPGHLSPIRVMSRGMSRVMSQPHIHTAAYTAPSEAETAFADEYIQNHESA